MGRGRGRQGAASRTASPQQEKKKSRAEEENSHLRFPLEEADWALDAWAIFYIFDEVFC